MVIYSKPGSEALMEREAPAWAQRFALRLRGHFKEKFPTEPVRVWYVDKIDLPPAADWPGALVVVVDEQCIAVARQGVWRKLALGGPV